MSYKLESFGRRKRRNFAKAEYSLAMPNLLDIQKKSYIWFQEEGIKEVLKDLSPVDSFTGSLSLEFGDYCFDEPRYTIKECKDKDATYSAPLKVQVRLFNHDSGEVKDQQIFLGDMPIMTDTGSFIVNGAERVIVSQLVRSPSVYFGQEMDKNGRMVYTSQIIPNRGTWLEYEMDARDVVYVRIDRTRKVTLTTLLRALGLSTDDDILDLFGEDEYIVNTLSKDSTRNTSEALIEIYEKLKPGEPPTIESAKNQIITRFFDDIRYDLAKVGRYKFNKKLNIVERLLDQTLAEDIVVNGKLILEKGTKLTKDNLDILEKYLKEGYGLVEVKNNEELNTFNKVQIIKVQSPTDKRKVLKVIGNDQSIVEKTLTISDVFASASYYFNLLHGVGTPDEIDHLGNRRIKQVGELLQNQFRIGLSRMERVIRERMTTQEIEAVTPKSLINIRPVTAAMKEFFGSSQLSQFLDQTNPIAELTSKRRLSALGPGGLSRDRAGMEVRDVHYSHYGRICPVESPEGPNIGLINYLAMYAVVNEYGFIMTPYRKVSKGKITDEIVYLTADEENGYYISQSKIKMSENGEIVEDNVDARYNGNNVFVSKDKINFLDIAPQQIISVTTDCIPFLEHDDAVRALMGANMQRQAVPLLTTEAPRVGTGIEHRVAQNSGVSIVAKAAGEVEYVDAKKIIIDTKNGKDTYYLSNFEPSNQGTCYTQRPIVEKGDKVKKDEIIADGPSTDQGELALGKNVVVAFMTYNGYNYEDAVILSERLVKDDVYTSVHIENHETQARETKLGPEEITRDIPNVSEEARRNLDASGIVRIGTEVKEGDILVGKVTPKGMTELSSEEKLLHAIFGEKTREVRDTSLRVPHGGDGIVHDIKIFSRDNKDELPAGVNTEVKVYIVQKRKIQVGDKMAGRHGNKGVISLILPEEDMPYLPDGTPVDVMLNPLGVPSRMNIGQVLEMHLGLASKNLNVHVATPVFDGAKYSEIKEMMTEAGIDEDGKTWLYDGRTGQKFDNKICVGVMYMIKLIHMVDDKLHARSTGPYSLVTQQPLGGKAQFGGQRFGEMEVWALYAYGAAHTLQEMMTVKSDDVVGRVRVYEALVKGNQIQDAGVPESFRVLVKEFQSLGLDISIVNDKDEVIELKTMEESEDKAITTLNIEEIDDADDSEFVDDFGGEAE